MNEVSELRQDPVSKEWVVIATGRSRRPDDFKKERKEESVTPIASCPFEDPEKSGNEMVYEEKVGGERWIKVINNKFPIFEGDKCGIVADKGPYRVQPGAGHHEVVITRDHSRSLGQMSQKEAEAVVGVYKKRYSELSTLDCSHYVLVFHNHGPEAGASVSHPHSQIAAIPMIPPDVQRSLDGSQRYFEENKRCVHCDMVDLDKKEDRVIFENDSMVVVSPYAPRTAFEIRIYPKDHKPFFEDSSEKELNNLAEALRVALSKIFWGLNDIAYNFFIHTAPVFGKDEHENYHWHIEILPKPPTPPAGLEFGTRINVSAINPNDAAEYLRGVTEKDSKEK